MRRALAILVLSSIGAIAHEAAATHDPVDHHLPDEVLALDVRGDLWHSPRSSFGSLWGAFFVVDEFVDGAGTVQAFQLADDGHLWILRTGGDLQVGTLPPSGKAFVPATTVATGVRTFQTTDGPTALVLDSDGALWIDGVPVGSAPAAHDKIAADVAAFQAGDVGTIAVLGWDGHLDLLYAPFAATSPTRRKWIDDEVAAFEFIDRQTFLVLGTSGNLFLEHAPFTNELPPQRRQQVASAVSSFQALGTELIVVLDSKGDLWLEHAPFGTEPTHRERLDVGIKSFHALDSENILVLDDRGELDALHAPFGSPASGELLGRGIRAAQAVGVPMPRASTPR